MSSNTPRDPQTIIQRLRASLDDHAGDFTTTPALTERVRRLRRRRTLMRRTAATLTAAAVVAAAAVFAANTLLPLNRVDFVSPVAPSPTAPGTASPSAPATVRPSETPSAATPSASPSHAGTPPASEAPPASEVPSDAQTAVAAPQLSADTPISLRGIGPVEAGMTLGEAEQAAGVDLIPQHFEDFGGVCYFAAAEGLEEDFLFQVRSPGSEPVDDPDDGIIGRVSATADMASPAETVSGVGVGASEEDVYNTYPGQIESAPHIYIEGGHYLTYVPRDAQDQGFRVRFFTDGSVVREIHAGDATTSGAVEGCS